MGAELAIAVDIERFDRPALVHVINAGNKGGSLRSYFTDADLISIASGTRRADIDVVVAGGEICTG